MFSRLFRHKPSNRMQPPAQHGEIEGEGGAVTPVLAINEVIPRGRWVIGARNGIHPMDNSSGCLPDVQFPPKPAGEGEPTQVIAGDFRIRKFWLAMFIQPTGYCASVSACGNSDV